MPECRPFCVATLVAAAILASCSGSPIETANVGPQLLARERDAALGRHWMAPRAAKSSSLLYVTGSLAGGSNNTYVFSYPDGRLVGELGAGGTAICSNAHGDVFVSDQNTNEVLEYAHGAPGPKQTLYLPGGPTDYVWSCSVDALTGNLAVVFGCDNPCASGVAVFEDAKGSPTTYTYSDGTTNTFCGYDNEGNLFVDTFSKSELLELPKGGSGLISLELSGLSGFPWQVQWDGGHIAIEDHDKPGSIYRIAISGSSATVVGTTRIEGITGEARASWIQDDHIVIPFNLHVGKGHYSIGIWKYPAGGTVTRILARDVFDEPFDVTISIR
jgi:hypothetical protein